MEDASGVDLAQFRLWYAQAGTPRVSATLEQIRQLEEAGADIVMLGDSGNDVLRLLVSTPRPGTECLPLFATAAFQGRLDRQTLRQRLYASLAQSGLGAAQDWRELAGMSDDEWRDVELATRTPASSTSAVHMSGAESAVSGHPRR